MDAIKKVIPSGEGKNDPHSGQEPVSGQQGAGTATQPYDAGNREDDPALGGKAPQRTASTPQSGGQSGQEPVSGKQGAGTATQPFDQGNREDDAELGGKAAQHSTSGDVTPTPESSQFSHTPRPDIERDTSLRFSAQSLSEGVNASPKLVKNPTIGSSAWFTNNNPFAKRSKSSEPSASESITSQREQRAKMTVEKEKSDPLPQSPSSQLGEDVSPGQHAIVHEPVFDPAFMASGNLPNHFGDDVPPGHPDIFDRSKGKGKGRAPLVEDTDYRDCSGATEVSSAASNKSERMRPESMVTDYTYPTAGTDASTIASSSRRSSGVLNIPHSKGMPITAGGVPLGFRAMQDRERRFGSMPIYEQPEQDYHAYYSKSVSNAALPKTQEAPEVPLNAPPASTLRANRRNDSVGVGEHAKKQPVTETPPRRKSVMQKAKNFGRKVRHSISS